MNFKCFIFGHDWNYAGEYRFFDSEDPKKLIPVSTRPLYKLCSRCGEKYKKYTSVPYKDEWKKIESKGV